MFASVSLFDRQVYVNDRSRDRDPPLSLAAYSITPPGDSDPGTTAIQIPAIRPWSKRFVARSLFSYWLLDESRDQVVTNMAANVGTKVAPESENKTLLTNEYIVIYP